MLLLRCEDEVDSIKCFCCAARMRLIRSSASAALREYDLSCVCFSNVTGRYEWRQTFPTISSGIVLYALKRKKQLTFVIAWAVSINCKKQFDSLFWKFKLFENMNLKNNNKLKCRAILCIINLCNMLKRFIYVGHTFQSPPLTWETNLGSHFSITPTNSRN